MNIERKTVHISDDSGRIGMYEYRTQGNDNSPQELMRYIYSNNIQSSNLELNEIGEIISYEEYHPFGTTSYQATNSQINAVAKRYRYTGKERDEESGLYYHGARYYIPWLCRWSQCDPIGIKDGLNVYAYCSNNPVMMHDPQGTQAQGREEKPESGKDTTIAPAAPAVIIDDPNSKTLYHKTNAAESIMKEGFDPNKSTKSGMTYFSENPNASGTGTRGKSTLSVKIDVSNVVEISDEKINEILKEAFKEYNAEKGTSYTSYDEIRKSGLKSRSKHYAITGIEGKFNELLGEFLKDKEGQIFSYKDNGNKFYSIKPEEVISLKPKMYSEPIIAKAFKPDSKVKAFILSENTAAFKNTTKVVRGLGYFGMGMSAWNIVTAKDKPAQIIKESFGWAGAWAGSKSLGLLGAEIAGPWGGLAGGFFGGILGYYFGSNLINSNYGNPNAPLPERPLYPPDNTNYNFNNFQLRKSNNFKF